MYPTCKTRNAIRLLVAPLGITTLSMLLGILDQANGAAIQCPAGQAIRGVDFVTKSLICIPVIGAGALSALQANIDAEAATRAAADTTLQTNINAEASARQGADSTLQGNINSEASARQTADSTLQTNINTETSARQTADNSLQSQITTNADNIAAVENEIGDKANNYANSRIDAAGGASAGIVGVIWTSQGGIEDGANHYRTLVLNPNTGELALRAELNHGLDYVGGGHSYWFCTIGEQIANADIQHLVETLSDDHAELDGAVGFNQPASGYWSFKFKNTQGANGKGSYAKIQVWDSTTSMYVVVEPTDAYPVSGWLYGERSNIFGQTRQVYIGLSHPQLQALIANVYPNIAFVTTADNHVIVDLNYSVTDLND